ncbi:MAG: DUF1385 domain-containing protein [Anaerolineales bacterium]|nr:DUF1385 domain-containing protein [Anaerolineales bacterium]
MEKPKFNYGGQAVMEGVMMRGAHIAAIAVRDPQGNIVIHEEALNAALYRGRMSRIPFVRGLVGLWDALVLGTRALIWSANVALREEEEESEPQPATEAKEGFLSKIPLLRRFTNMLILSVRTMNMALGMGGSPQPTGNKSTEAFSDIAVVGIVALSLSMGIGLFFALPAAASNIVQDVFNIKSRLAVDTIEGVVKLGIFVGYIAAIGFMEDVKRLFGYHGAEHKTINAYEAGSELVPEQVQTHSIEHPRCGTAFLLTVMLLSVVVHAITGRPDNIVLLIIARVSVVPIIAGLAYEVIRFTARHSENPIVKLIIIPNLALQRLTTRQPDTSMLEVAIAALQRVLLAEEAVARGETLNPQEEIILPRLEGAAYAG